MATKLEIQDLKGDIINIGPNDVIALQCPIDKFTIDEVQSFYEIFKECFPDHDVALIPEGMIDKIHILRKS